MTKKIFLAKRVRVPILVHGVIRAPVQVVETDKKEKESVKNDMFFGC